MMNERRNENVGATNSGAQPGRFELGSEKSRAAARALLQARDEVATAGDHTLAVVRSVLFRLPPERCIEILREAGHISKTTNLVNVTSIPTDLSTADTEAMLRERGADFVRPFFNPLD